MKDSYIYPAVVTREEGGFAVGFPDLPGCLTCGDTIEEAVTMARDAMSLHLYGMEQDGDSIPEPSDPSRLELEANQFVVLVDAWMPVFRSRMQSKTVNKMLTLPKWLSDMGEREKVNFSGLLQEALKERLGVHEPPTPYRVSRARKDRGEKDRS